MARSRTIEDRHPRRSQKAAGSGPFSLAAINRSSRDPENPSSRARIFQVALGLSFLLLHDTVHAEDIVHLHPTKQGGKSYSVRGTIVEFTGRELTLRGQGGSQDAKQGGRDRRFPADRVVRIETSWPKAKELGDGAVATGKFDEAARQFSAANRAEKRTWARRLILAELIVCLRAVGQEEQAADIFLAILRSDPDAPIFDRIPLAWYAGERVSVAKAVTWAGQKESQAAVLLGASHLLSTKHRKPATEALRQLATIARDRRIAALAESQLWRAQVVTARDDDVQRWLARIEQMPPGIVAGPYFVLAQGLDRLGRTDDAALAYLRVPVLFPDDRPLAARALLGAARATNRAGHTGETGRLLREIIRDYRESPDRSEAERILKSL